MGGNHMKELVEQFRVAAVAEATEGGGRNRAAYYELEEQLLDRLKSPLWSNIACLGYAVKVAEQSGMNEQQISELIRNMYRQFGDMSIDEAKRSYIYSEYSYRGGKRAMKNEVKRLVQEQETNIGGIGVQVELLQDVSVELGHLREDMDTAVHRGQEHFFYPEHHRQVRILSELTRYLMIDLTECYENARGLQQTIHEVAVKEVSP